jgi:hypothetical protein
MKIVREYLNENFKPIRIPGFNKENPYKGEVYVSHKNLDTLKDATTEEDYPIPKYINGDFVCMHNNLTSLEGGPRLVSGDFYCRNNDLPEEEVIRYWKTGAVKGVIYSDYEE